MYDIIKLEFDKYFESNSHIQPKKFYIYFPRTNQSATSSYYDITLLDYCDKLNCSYINQQLKIIFKKYNIKYKILLAYHKSEIGCTGLIVVLKKKKYANDIISLV